MTAWQHLSILGITFHSLFHLGDLGLQLALFETTFNHQKNTADAASAMRARYQQDQSDADKCVTYSEQRSNITVILGRDGRDGIVGPKGEGMKGDMGEQGRRGPPGVKGKTGEKGQQGDQPTLDLAPGETIRGNVYTRWGMKTCPDTSGTELVYDGVAGGSHYTHHGGAANYICLVKEPEYLSTQVASGTSAVYGSEYESPLQDPVLNNHNVPCAICYTSERTARITIPGKVTCPEEWTKEYSGYLMTGNHGHKHTYMFECMDEESTYVPGTILNTNGALFYHVGATSNTGIPCGPYIPNRAITCVVCTI